jgi:hypothetical protein
MDSWFLRKTQSISSGVHSFYIESPVYGVVGLLEGFFHTGNGTPDGVVKATQADASSFHVSWLYIEPYFRLNTGIKIINTLIKQEISKLAPSLKFISYKRKFDHSRPHKKYESVIKLGQDEAGLTTHSRDAIEYI